MTRPERQKLGSMPGGHELAGPEALFSDLPGLIEAGRRDDELPHLKPAC
ncbi:hypothetical protein [Lichenibacterium dinghuense]|nr:hypothetical protein [Lichenibacterium sp. 6Y81]